MGVLGYGEVYSPRATLESGSCLDYFGGGVNHPLAPEAVIKG